MELRNYQKKLISETYAIWNRGVKNVLIQLATGGGKTVLFSKILADHNDYAIAIAHRVELISQISLTLAKHGIKHQIYAQPASIREIISLHIKELGASFYDARSPIIVAGIDTLLRMDKCSQIFKRITLVIQDEGHHALKKNKWGKAADLFPNARGLYLTATPIRADGSGLGRAYDGLIDEMITGPTIRELINMGYLCDYEVKCPPNNIDLSTVEVSSATGDFNQHQLRNAVHKSRIVGDIVQHYLKFAQGKLGITFAVDIESATEIALNFKTCGVKAEVVSSKTPVLIRADIMRRFRNREILQIVNVDILGEGVDVPAVEVVSLGRPTESFSLFSQQVGRAMRPSPGKQKALILDHVNNFIRHNSPERAATFWTLARRDKRAKSQDAGVIPLTVCRNPECVATYERIKPVCPHCGTRPIPKPKGIPEYVDGDLMELSQEFMDKMLAQIYKIKSEPPVLSHLNPIAQAGARKKHNEKQKALVELCDKIALWAGYYRSLGQDKSEISKRFYFTFGIDILSAQVLSRPEAEKLIEKVQKAIDEIIETGVEFADWNF